MATRNNPIELALNFFSGGVLLIHPKDIGELDDPTHPYADLAADCHIYLIVTRSRLTYVPGSIEIGPNETTGRFRYTKDGVATEAKFWLNGYPNAEALRISEYPHSKLHLIKDGNVLYTLPASTLSFMCDGVSDQSIRDLEVVYVGMAYGEGGRSAKDRLASHSTLQQVLADINGDTPDLETLLVMVEYKPPMMIMSFDGRTKSPTVPPRNVGTAHKATEETVTENVQITLIEAALIRYFQPRYNDKYKRRFPHPRQKILSEIYNIDYAALGVEIDTEDIHARLFSPTRPPGFHHVGNVDLHEPSERQSFFQHPERSGRSRCVG